MFRVLERLVLRRFRLAARFGFGLGFCGVLLSLVPAILTLDETIGLELLFAARGPMATPPGVVVVNISRESAEGVGEIDEVDEWPRSLHASLIESLFAAGAQAIAFDIIFEEPRADDAEFAAAIAHAGDVILLEKVSDKSVGSGNGVSAVVETRVLPVADLKAAALASAPFPLPKVPIRMSQFWTFGRGGGDIPSLPVAALQTYLLPRYEEFTALLGRVRPALLDGVPMSRAEAEATHDLAGVMRRIRVQFQRDPELAPQLRSAVREQPPGEDTDALRLLIDLYAGPNSRYLNFYGPPGTIRTIRYDIASKSPPEMLDVAGKVVFVGFAEPRQSEQDDDFISVFSQRSGANLSGVEIGASAFANLLDRRSLAPLIMPAHLSLVLAWGLLLGAALVGLPTRRVLALAAFAAAFYAALAYWAFAEYDLWLPLVVPLFLQVPAAAIVAVSLNYRQVLRQREHVQAALGYYVPRSIATRLAEQSVTSATSRQLLQGTCLFTDAEEYTTVSEGLRPEDLAGLMNEYYGVMFGVVERHGGMVSNTSGDSMVAVWATAQSDAAARLQACRAALEIVEAVAEFNRGRGRQQLPTRVGLESGEILLGNIGAEQRFEYRAIGDIVNTASRLQGLNRLLGTRVLVSEATIAGVPGLVTRDLGKFLLRGKKTPVRVCEPLGFDEVVCQEDKLLAVAFSAALGEFASERWADAERAFAETLVRFPGDGPSAFYSRLCAEYRADPRPWAGAIAVAMK